jgi:hypothetical protein
MNSIRECEDSEDLERTGLFRSTLGIALSFGLPGSGERSDDGQQPHGECAGARTGEDQDKDDHSERCADSS